MTCIMGKVYFVTGQEYGPGKPRTKSNHKAKTQETSRKWQNRHMPSNLALSELLKCSTL